MRSSHTLALCLFLAGAAQAQDLNVVTSVEVKDEGDSVTVSVKGSKPPNFTTFSMADPARFVIDLSETKFQGVPEDLRFDDGVVRIVKNLAYGSGASAIARVMIAFSVDVEPPDVQTDGNSLLVRVAKPAGAAVAGTAAKPAGAAAASGAGDGAAAVAAAAVAKSEADQEARQVALAREQVEAEAREQARKSAEATAKEREAQAQLEAQAKVREAEQLAARQAAEEEEARVAADARRAEIRAKVAAPAVAAPAGPTLAGPTLAEPTPAEPTPAVAAPAEPTPTGPTPAELAAAAAAERTAANQSKADAKAEAKARREAEQAAANQSRADAKAEVKARREAEQAAAAQAAAEARAAAVAARPAKPARLQAIGFKQLPTVSRVFVKTSTTPRFTITDVGDDVVRLEVENTHSTRRNDTRPLDTSFFASAVALISPSNQGTSYVVDIRLKKRVPYQQKVEGELLAIDFERPPADAAAAGALEGRPAGTPSEEALENEQGLVASPDEEPEGAAPASDASPAAATEQPPKQ